MSAKRHLPLVWPGARCNAMTNTCVAAKNDDGKATWLALSAGWGLLGCTCIAGMAQILSCLPLPILIFCSVACCPLGLPTVEIKSEVFAAGVG